jgi:hypothetical protein
LRSTPAPACAFGDESAKGNGRILGELAQLGIERHADAALRLAVEQRTLGHRAAGHFFQAQRLGAELDLVGAMQLRLAALVFDRERRFAIGARMEFNHVGDAGDVEAQAGEGQRSDTTHAAAFA